MNLETSKRHAAYSLRYSKIHLRMPSDDSCNIQCSKLIEYIQDGEVTIEQENESLKQQVEELLAKVEAMTKKETDLSYKLAELSDEYKRQGARFKRETEKTKVSQNSETVPFH